MNVSEEGCVASAIRGFNNLASSCRASVLDWWPEEEATSGHGAGGLLQRPGGSF